MSIFSLIKEQYEILSDEISAKNQPEKENIEKPIVIDSNFHLPMTYLIYWNTIHEPPLCSATAVTAAAVTYYRSHSIQSREPPYGGFSFNFGTQCVNSIVN